MAHIQVLVHSSIKIEGKKVVYIDPFQLTESPHDADYIFFTHPHDDHFSLEDIEKVSQKTTKYILPESIEKEKSSLLPNDQQIKVKPNEKYEVEDFTFETTYAYNLNKQFHPKENAWVGYVLTIEGIRYYIAGDTDSIPEIQTVSCDIAFLPVGGTYTMDYQEAAKLANQLPAQVVIPTHYGSIVGTKEEGKKFATLIQKKEVKVFIE